MENPQSASTRILQLLGGIAGVHAVRRLSAEQLRSACELEAGFESSSVIPIHNIGVQLLSQRDACFVLLKDGRVRPPKVPTVHLVEEGAPAGSPHAICVDEVWYTIVGEEIIDEGAPRAETVIPLGSSFAIYPGRRGNAALPCTFILPPIAFPELEGQVEGLGISRIISISPSLAADGYLRTAFDFPPTNRLATLLIGCDLPKSAEE